MTGKNLRRSGENIRNFTIGKEQNNYFGPVKVGSLSPSLI